MGIMRFLAVAIFFFQHTALTYAWLTMPGQIRLWGLINICRTPGQSKPVKQNLTTLTKRQTGGYLGADADGGVRCVLG
jgi:hypothetical protein